MGGSGGWGVGWVGMGSGGVGVAGNFREFSRKFPRTFLEFSENFRGLPETSM